MKKRLITGIAILIWIVAVFLLKFYLQAEVLGRKAGSLIFDFCLMIIAVIGAYEMTRALGDKMIKTEKVLAVLFPIAVMPLASLIGMQATVIAMLVAAVVTLSLFVVRYSVATIEGIAYTFLIFCYPTIILALLVAVNHIEMFTNGKIDSFAPLLTTFVVSPLADVFAYTVGSIVKGKKLCPAISPNKTVSGAIGGLIGGTLGGIIAYFVPWLLGAKVHYFSNIGFDLLLFGGLGFVCSVLTEFGDLVESAIKRKLGIKDMGNILPGHGGMMDRIDGLLFASPLMVIVFCVILPLAL